MAVRLSRLRIYQENGHGGDEGIVKTPKLVTAREGEAQCEHGSTDELKEAGIGRGRYRVKTALRVDSK